MRPCVSCDHVFDEALDRCPSCGAHVTLPDAATAVRSALKVPSQPPLATPAPPARPRASVDTGAATFASSSAATEPARPADPNVGRVVAGRYEVVSLLGAGGMGRVYKARHVELGKLVCLKKLRADLTESQSETLVARFRNEAQTTSRLDHPNIIKVLDFGTDSDGGLFYVMEMVDGRDLDEIAQEGRLADVRIVRILEQVLDALAEAHAHKVVHRDLKPQNIMIEQRRNHPDFARILDFGIAKLLDHTRLTMTGHIVGTAYYMSPEQALAHEIDTRSDLYSVGVILYELATGILPFEADTPTAVLFQHVNVPARPPRLWRPDIPPRLETLILRALSKEPKDRPQTAEEFREELLAIGRTLPTGPAMSAPAALRDSHVVTQPSAAKPLAPGDAPEIFPKPRVETADQSVEDIVLVKSRYPWRVPAIAIGLVALVAIVASSLRPTDPRPAAVNAPPMPVVAAPPAPKPTLKPTSAVAESPGKQGKSVPVAWDEKEAKEKYWKPPPSRPTGLPPGIGVKGAPALAEEPVRAEVEGPKKIFIAPIPPEPPATPVAPTPIAAPVPPFEPSMVRLAAASAVVGCDGPECDDDERPRRTVPVAEFRMDRFEVSGGEYARCVEAGACTSPATAPGCLRADPGEKRPVNCVTWAQADTYCRWRGARLPTELEWERAARGANGREFPWGDQPPDCARAQFSPELGKGCGVLAPVPGGVHAMGATPEGVHDLAGNVKEWTSSFYGQNITDPPSSGTKRVTRGGAFDTGPTRLNAHARLPHAPDRPSPSAGFRCVK